MSKEGGEHRQAGVRIEDSMLLEKVETVIERISSHKNVEGVIVCDKDGAAITTTMDNTNTVMYAEGIRTSAIIANAMVRDIDPANHLLYIRIGTKKQEMMGHWDPDYFAVLIQARIKTPKKEVEQSAI